ncbi:MAG: hypothetical protein RBU23_05730 [Candidatus Auribacterota bacterium]|jgi:hypothetical protein|nr:hypothetical protein [Candidatus Auribacterota bacterium]
MREKVIRNYFFLCDTVIRDSQSGSFSFINVRRSMISESFPCSMGGFFVAAGFKLSALSGDYKNQITVQLKIISPSNKIVFDIKQIVPMEQNKGDYHGIDFIIQIGRFTCKEPGNYRIQLLDFGNELVLGETDFEVLFPPRPNFSQKSPEEIEKLLEHPDVIKKVESSVRCPHCKHEKTFTICLERDLFKRMEQEIAFPDDLIYTCEQCGEWKIHLGRMMLYMYKKLGSRSQGKK